MTVTGQLKNQISATNVDMYTVMKKFKSTHCVSNHRICECQKNVKSSLLWKSQNSHSGWHDSGLQRLTWFFWGRQVCKELKRSFPRYAVFVWPSSDFYWFFEPHTFSIAPSCPLPLLKKTLYYHRIWFIEWIFLLRTILVLLQLVTWVHSSQEGA